MSQSRDSKDIASDILEWAESAVVDIAAAQEITSHLYYEDEYDCEDPVGARADDLYNDDDTMIDLLGDRLHDESKGNKELRNEIINELQKLMNHLPESTWKTLRR